MPKMTILVILHDLFECHYEDYIYIYFWTDHDFHVLVVLILNALTSKVIDPDIISGNLTASISDHLPQFTIIPNIFGNILGNKSKI